jgi:putative tryptophan/tyrosine transport system substrate-binding protein
MQDSTLGIVVCTLSLLWLPHVATAQRRATIPVVGVLEPGPPPTVAPRACLEAFRHGLRELGYQEGHNVILEYRYAEFTPDRLPTLAAELVQHQPEVIWTHSNLAARALTQATTTLPIVVGTSTDLEEQGLVERLGRPGGNLTGLESRSVELTHKRLELLKEVLPQSARVGLLVDPATQVQALLLSAFEAEAQGVGLKLLRVEAGEPGAFDAAFATLVAHRVDALVLIDSALFATHAPRLPELARAHRLPSIAAIRSYAQAGGLLAHGANIPELCQRSAVHVDKILKGAKPAGLPVERAHKFQLVVNLKTAQTLGMVIPLHILTLADEVIQ